MHSLSELRDLFARNKIQIKDFTGWELKVGEDVWTLSDSKFYLNGEPKNPKESEFIDNYKKVNYDTDQINQTKHWRGISCRRIRGNITNDNV